MCSENTKYLNVPTSELNLSVALFNGQSFRWRKISASELGCTKNSAIFIGIACHRLWKLWREDEESIGFEVLNRFSLATGDDKDVLKKYFQLEVPLRKLYTAWSRKDPHFRNVLVENRKVVTGIRIFAQDPFETVLAFICSANNNIRRITRMVEQICELYGENVTLDVKVDGIGGTFYDFPQLERMVDDEQMESKFRKNGFGYRAGYLHHAVRKLKEFGGENWLTSLASLDYSAAKQNLERLPGVGPKVADCVCLMGLRMNSVVPIDTHVLKLTAAYYLPTLTNKKAVGKQLYRRIGEIWYGVFGEYAGWAHSVFFSTQLQNFKKKKLNYKKPLRRTILKTRCPSGGSSRENESDNNNSCYP